MIILRFEVLTAVKMTLFESTRRHNPEEHRKLSYIFMLLFTFIYLNICIVRIFLCKIGNVALGGIVVSVLTTGPKVRGFKPGRGRWILRVIKSVARLPSEGR
jgi:hypothetical protein